LHRRTLSFGVLILFLSLTLPGVVSAHVLKLDGTIAGILHGNPDDSTPIAGKPADYILMIDDATSRFSLPDCTCTISVIQGAQVLSTRPLFVTGTNVSENHYTFQQSGLYTLRFAGTPKGTRAFQPFTLNYTVTVAPGQPVQRTPLLFWIGAGVGIGIVMAVSYATNRRNRS
jgi:hypothetical protein